MPFPRTPRAILRAALVALLIAAALSNAVILIASPEQVAPAWASTFLPDIVLGAAGLASILLAFLTMRRVTRGIPLLVIGGVAGLPLMTTVVQAQPVVVAGLLMAAVVVGCAVLDRAWLEAVWAGRRF
jgi:hypothetical protein